MVRLGAFPVNRSERQPEARPLQAEDVCEGLESLPNVTRSLSTEVTGSALGSGNEPGCSILCQLEMVEGAFVPP